MAELSYFGSFQRGLLFNSENPQEEVWAQLGRIGTPEYAASIQPENPTSDWSKHVRYSSVRIRQALELRHSSSGTSVLSKPILLYYSFLNLLRACLALGPETISPPTHGLVYRPNEEFLANEAELAEGTFTTFLKSKGIAWGKGTRYSLKFALSKIPELSFEFKSPDRGQSNALALSVKAKMSSNDILLHFDTRLIDEQTFRTNWAKELPKLKDLCELEPTGAILRLMPEHKPKDYDGICALCENTMLNRLVFGNEPTWHVIRINEGEQELPRAAYYFISLFILGSIARYQPELLQSSLPPASEPEWFFKRFLQTAERFFPQLMHSWLYKKQSYFQSY